MFLRCYCHAQRTIAILGFILGLVAISLSSATTQAQTTNGLIAHYSFDGLEGPVIDSVGDFHAVNRGAIRGVSGRLGSAFQFDGRDSYVDTIPASAIPENCTISLWVYPTDMTAEKAGQLFGSVSRIQEGPHGLVVNYYEIDSNEADGTPSSYREGVASIFYHDRGRMLSPRNSFPLNSWTHLTISFDRASNFKIYANGVLTASEVVQQFAGALVHDRALMFGQGILSQSVGFDGKMDEVRIYDRVLSDAEVLEIYQSDCNQDPIADAGDDIVAECAGPLTLVQLDGSWSSDPDGDELSFVWSVAAESGAQLDDHHAESPFGLFPVGPTWVTLTVTDGNGGIDVTDVLVTVEDTTPPALICTTDKIALWPPKHQMEKVWICIEVSEECSSPEDLQIKCTISSNEPDDANGDGATAGDVDGLDGFTSPVQIELVYDEDSGCFRALVSLRAERNGLQDGRVYSIVCDAMDDHGNKATASCVIVVPHSNRRK